MIWCLYFVRNRISGFLCFFFFFFLLQKMLISMKIQTSYKLTVNEGCSYMRVNSFIKVVLFFSSFLRYPSSRIANVNRSGPRWIIAYVFKSFLSPLLIHTAFCWGGCFGFVFFCFHISWLYPRPLDCPSSIMIQESSCAKIYSNFCVFFVWLMSVNLWNKRIFFTNNPTHSHEYKCVCLLTCACLRMYP